jgi:hypothetical protein
MLGIQQCHGSAAVSVDHARRRRRQNIALERSMLRRRRVSSTNMFYLWTDSAVAFCYSGGATREEDDTGYWVDER